MRSTCGSRFSPACCLKSDSPISDLIPTHARCIHARLTVTLARQRRRAHLLPTDGLRLGQGLCEKPPMASPGVRNRTFHPHDSTKTLITWEHRALCIAQLHDVMPQVPINQKSQHLNRLTREQ